MEVRPGARPSGLEAACCSLERTDCGKKGSASEVCQQGGRPSARTGSTVCVTQLNPNLERELPVLFHVMHSIDEKQVKISKRKWARDERRKQERAALTAGAYQLSRGSLVTAVAPYASRAFGKPALHKCFPMCILSGTDIAGLVMPRIPLGLACARLSDKSFH